MQAGIPIVKCIGSRSGRSFGLSFLSKHVNYKILTLSTTYSLSLSLLSIAEDHL